MGKVISTAIQLSSAALFLTSAALSQAESSARFVQNEAKLDFIAEKTSLFTINKREFDPFGKPQDPNKKAPKKVEVTKQSPKVVEQKVLIQQEIDKLAGKINILGKRFLHGSKSYRRNDQIIVVVKGKEFPLKISSIRRNKITFIDLSDNSFVILDLNKANQPQGFGSANDDQPQIDTGKPGTIELD